MRPLVSTYSQKPAISRELRQTASSVLLSKPWTPHGLPDRIWGTCRDQKDLRAERDPDMQFSQQPLSMKMTRCC